MRQAARLVSGLVVALIYSAATLSMGIEPAAVGKGLVRVSAAFVIGAGLTSHFLSWVPALALWLAFLGLAVFLYSPLDSFRAGKPNDLLVLGIYSVLAGGLIWGGDSLKRKPPETLERYRLVVESAPDGILITDAEGGHLWANSKACQMFGYRRRELPELGLRDLVEPECLEALRGQSSCCLSSDGSLLRECQGRRKDGGRLVVELSGKMLSDGTFMAIVRDVTERKQAEEQIRASLRQKEVLLKEIHHRVKNNLQVISSLLSLQSRHIQDPRTLAEFNGALERIKSVALLHEKLSLSRDLARIHFCGYLESLVRDLSLAYQLNREAVSLRIDAGEVWLDLEKAMPCALIVNELVSNAMKHAFPGGRAGEIRIGLTLNADCTLTLTVSDTGVGLPGGAEPSHSESLGLRLVATLTRQLKGLLEVSSHGGTEFRITFPNDSMEKENTNVFC